MSIEPGPGRTIAQADPRRGARLAVEGLTMTYGPVRVLDGIDLVVEPGESLAVVGPSGCGKSTLLGLLGGLELPTAGEVVVGPHHVSALPERARTALRRRAFGFVFQSDNLQPFLTAWENVALQSVLAGRPDDARTRSALLDALGIGELGSRFPDQLSGGQRQRVAVARALVHDPLVVLADEPTGALDVASAARVVDLLLDLSRRKGTTLVVVTHDRAVAERMDRLVELRAGRLVQTAARAS